MTFVVRVFQPADHRRGRPDTLRQFTLGEVRFGAEFIDLTRNASIQKLFFEGINALPILADVAIVGMLQGSGADPPSPLFFGI